MPASVSLLIGNNIVAAVQEERFTRKKNDEEFPVESIRYCLDFAKIDSSELDAVAIASFVSPFDDQLVRKSQWTVQDYLTEQHQRWKPYLVDKSDKELKSLLDVFPEKIDFSMYPPDFWKSLYRIKDRQKLYLTKRLALFADHLNIPVSKIHAVDHHRAHAYYSYYCSPFRKDRVLALTIDGWGDGMNATAGVFEPDGHYQRIYHTDQCAIARIYRYMTLLLGMKPNEHEFKLMGLAPYGKAIHGQDALQVFRQTLQVDGIEFRWKVKPTDSYFWFKERLEGFRFDSIAWALQSWVEELLLKWVGNCIKKFGIGNVVLSGGVAMNVKAIGRLPEIADLDDLFVAGSPSDESLAIGSAYCLSEDLTRSDNSAWNTSEVLPLSSLNLGPESSVEAESALLDNLDTDVYRIEREVRPHFIAQLLADGYILARCSGRMEFGQRALGNRSILADPVNMEIKDRINSAIKSRDFWMPFAPVILDSYAKRYLINPKNIQSPFMTIGFNTTDEGYDAMKAACHPADRTARPQILREESNPDLYLILKAFEEITGRGALLNTSYNLHGYPIVNTPSDAMDVFTKSDLDGLVLNSSVILKN
jgi:carbamoyltransferase